MRTTQQPTRAGRKTSFNFKFYKNAWDKYRQLTGSQKTFIDRELDDLKFNQNRQKSKMVNAELDQALVFEKMMQR